MIGMGLGFMFWLWTLLTGSKRKAYHLEGRRLLAASQNIAALNVYREMVGHWPNQPDGYLGLSQAYQAMGLRPEAAREEKIGESLDALKKNPDDLAYRMDLASALMEKELYGRAAGHIDYALQLAPKQKELLKLAAKAFNKNRNYSKASTVLDELIKQEPLEAAHYEALTKNLKSARLTHQAVKSSGMCEALKAVLADPGNSELADRAVRHFVAGGYKERALMLIERCLQGNEDKAGLHRLMGELLLDERESGKAVESLKKAVSLDPVDIRAHALLGRAYQREGNLQLAEQHLGLVNTIENAKKSKDPLEVSVAMVRVLIDSGNLDQALQQAELVNKQHEDDWRAPYIMGIALRATGNIKEAMRQLQRAMTVNSIAPEPHLEMALLQSDAGEVLEAVGEARKAVNLSPRDPEIRRILANVLRTHGYTDQAIEEEELAEAFVKKS
jgi:tetratricopeptide (TPR) repeat protein